MRGRGTGQLVDAHPPLFTNPPHRSAEGDQVRICVSARVQRKRPNCVKTIVYKAVSTYLP